MAAFYVLYSIALDRYYLGHSELSVEQRLVKHLSDHSGWTARAKDWRIMHREEFPDKSSAYRRELEVKRWKNRRRIEELFASGTR